MFQVVPSVDLIDGKVVRLQQGDYARQLNYDFDPVETARQFESAGAEWMHVVDLDGARLGAVSQIDLIEKIIAATKLKVQVGGGVRSTADIESLLNVGATRVVVGTKAIEDWPWFESLTRDSKFAQKLVLALDARDGHIATRAWTQSSGTLAVDVAKLVSQWPLGAILYTDVAKDGMLAGPNYTTTQQLARAGTIPVIASGGVRDITHIRKLVNLGIWGVIVGRSLHENMLNLAEAIAEAKNSNK